MILAIDTCEARGSVAVLNAGVSVAQRSHDGREDYSVWLLPAVRHVLTEAHRKMDEVSLFAAATGPGSFTGLRVGLTTVKAWAEVFRKPVVGVSRLEAMARSFPARRELVAACYDAYRGQLFGALYRRSAGQLQRIGEELVISAEQFCEWVNGRAAKGTVDWVSLDPEMITTLEEWKHREGQGDTIQSCPPSLASVVGVLAQERAERGEFSNPLELDANYVRRSDAEILWKGPTGGVC